MVSNEFIDEQIMPELDRFMDYYSNEHLKNKEAFDERTKQIFDTQRGRNLLQFPEVFDKFWDKLKAIKKVPKMRWNSITINEKSSIVGFDTRDRKFSQYKKGTIVDGVNVGGRFIKRENWLKSDRL